MKLWPSLKGRSTQREAKSDAADLARTSRYIAEYIAAIDRTERFGFEAPPRVLVRKDCVNMQVLLPLLLDFYDAHWPEDLIGQTMAINLALIPLLYAKAGTHFNLTIGWMVREGKPIFPHDEGVIRRFVEDGSQAWLREGCAFHLWMTSPACEILDITYAMNLGQARTREQCSRLIVYQSAHEPAADSVYHPSLVGPDFFHKTGAVL